ncbi:MAG: hypothetical protein L3J96_03640, partial [Thermoplasmata archaeon]|nr:hypothetical protein [Thermoplasmata archaeon]
PARGGTYGSSAPLSVPSPGLRRERLPGGRLAALFILSASMESSGSLRELALLAANRRDAFTEVYHRAGVNPAINSEPTGVPPILDPEF